MNAVSASDTSSKNLGSHKNKHKNCTKFMVRTKATEDWDNQHLMLHQAREFEIKILWTEETLFKIKTLLQQTLLVEVKKMAKF